MPTDVERAFTAIKNKRPYYDDLWNYYDGDHPLIYSASRLKEIFRHMDANFSENWCAVVVDSLLDRIRIERFTVPGQEALDERLTRLWLDTQLILDSYDAHLCALVTGEAAILVGLDESGQVEAYYNDSRMIHVEYETARPHVIAWAAKLWQQDDGWNLTLYYRARFEHYRADKRDVPDTARAFVLDVSEQNPFGRIPLFHLTRERRGLHSEMKNIINPQNQLNKLLADLMVAAEFGAFKQRYIISQIESKNPLKNQPGLIWDIPAGDGVGQQTQVGELSATDLGNYLAALDRCANVIAAISGTPKHYFFQTGTAPSGEALKAMEAPLTKKATRFTERFEPVWRALAAFLLELDGSGVFLPGDLDVVWTEAATETPMTEALTAQAYVNAGMPLVTALRKQGWGATELEQLSADRAEEQAGTATLGAALMADAERNFSRNGGS